MKSLPMNIRRIIFRKERNIDKNVFLKKEPRDLTFDPNRKKSFKTRIIEFFCGEIVEFPTQFDTVLGGNNLRISKTVLPSEGKASPIEYMENLHNMNKHFNNQYKQNLNYATNC